LLDVDIWLGGLSTMPRGTRVLEIVQAIAEAEERGDEGDMDSPAWENDDRLLRLYTELKILGRSLAREAREESALPPASELSGFGGLPAT
jgi:hypothetical protein